MVDFVNNVRSFVNYAIFCELCDRMRFEVDCAKSHHRVMHLSMSSPMGGGGGGRATHGTLTVVCIPRVGILIGHYAFYLSILKSRREENHFFLLILTILFCLGWGF